MNQGSKAVCQLYRNILKGMKNYPSSKKEKLIVAIKEEFHAHASETDPKKIARYRSEAEAGFKQIEQYSKNNTRGSMTYTIGK